MKLIISSGTSRTPTRFERGPEEPFPNSPWDRGSIRWHEYVSSFMAFIANALVVLGGCLIVLWLVAGKAAAQEWTQVSRSSTHTYWMQLSSMQYDSNKAGEQVVVVNLRENRPDGSVGLERNYVRAKHCEAGMGKLVSLDMVGNYKYDNDFVLEGGNVASTIATWICTFHKVRQGRSL